MIAEAYFLRPLMKILSVFLEMASALSAALTARFVAASARSAAISAALAAASALWAAASNLLASSSKRALAASARAAASLASLEACIADSTKALSLLDRPQPAGKTNRDAKPKDAARYRQDFTCTSIPPSLKSMPTFYQPIIKYFKLILSILVVIGYETSIWAFNDYPQKLIVIRKDTRILSTYLNGKLKEQFPISLGLDPISAKTKSGDGATPEGFYTVTYKKFRSRFYRFLGLSYPNLHDADQAYLAGIISRDDYQLIWEKTKKGLPPPGKTPLGGGVGIHGGGLLKDTKDGDKIRDWTEGCIALKNKDMEKLFDWAEIGTPVLILNARRSFFDQLKSLSILENRLSSGLPIKNYTQKWRGEFIIGPFKVKSILQETLDYQRSIELLIYQDDCLLTYIYDHNGDGILGYRDSLIHYQKGYSLNYKNIKDLFLQYPPLPKNFLMVDSEKKTMKISAQK